MKTEYIPIITALISAISTIVIAVINSNAKKTSTGSKKSSANQTWMIIFAVLFFASLGYIFLGGGIDAPQTSKTQATDTIDTIPKKSKPKPNPADPVKKKRREKNPVRKEKSEEQNKEIIKSKDFYESVGTCVIDRAKFTNESQAVLMAKKCAEIVAKAELLEQIKGVEIEKNDVVENLMQKSSVIKTKVEGVIKSAYIVGSPVVHTDVVEVVVRLKKQDLTDAVTIKK